MAFLFFLFYLAPTFIVLLNKKNPNKGGVIILDVFLGWTIICWIIALVKAFNTSKIITEK